MEQSPFERPDLESTLPTETAAVVAPTKQEQPTSRPGWLVFALLVVIVALLYRYRVPLASDLFQANADARAVTPRGELSSQELSQIELFEMSSPSVVHITTNKVGLIDRRTQQVGEVESGNGTGFIWDDSGYIVTNFHVLKEADSATVVLNDYTSFPAKLVGYAPDKDLAVLKIDVPAGRKLRPIPVGTSSDLRVGQFVGAIGSPFGLEQTFTTGIVSALDRTIEAIERRRILDVVQTDAAINPGNSGGPLLDSAGRLIGVTTAIAGSSAGTSSGVGFAIPVDTVNRYVPQLIRNGVIERPGLGVVLLSQREFSELLKRKRVAQRGVIIRDAPPGSSAAAAGLRGMSMSDQQMQLGDLIVALDGEPITSNEQLISAIQAKSVGDVVELTIVRDGERQDVPVQLQDLSSL